MSHPKAKLLHVEQNRYGIGWCRTLYYKLLMNPLTFAKMLVKKNRENVSSIRRWDYDADERCGDVRCVTPEEFLKLKYQRKNHSEFWITFVDGSSAVIHCWRREADIAEVSL